MDLVSTYDPAFLKAIVATGGYLYLAAPRKAYVKMSPAAIQDTGTTIDGTTYVWLESLGRLNR